MIKTAFTYKGLKIEYMRSRKTSKTIITVLILFLLSACAGSDSKKYDGKLKIEDGMAMPMTLYGDPSADNANSNILRYCVYVETDHDTDGDGKADLVKVLIQLPKSAAEGKYKAAAIYDPTPYTTGTVQNMVTLLESPFGEDTFDKTKLYNPGEKRESLGSSDTMTAVKNADQSEWIYSVPASNNPGYYTMNLYDYYLIRGFAIVLAGGIGTYGSEGYELCGTDLERDSHKAVVEWLAGNRKAFTDKENNIEITADWCNGNVAMIGGSYGGTLPYEVATTGVEGLKTIIPIAGIANWYGYTNSQGVAINAYPHYSETLSAMNAASSFKDDAWLIPNLDYIAWLRQQKADEEKANGNYDETWAALDYSRDYEKINCSALIIHGLNDFNVMTTQSNLMYQAFKKANQDVKVILHQDGHNHIFGKMFGDTLFDELLNKWLCHYLYDVDNGIEELPEINVQSNIDAAYSNRDVWEDLKLVSYKPEGQSGEHLIHSRNLDAAASALINDAFDSDQYYHDLNEEEAAVYDIPLPENALISGIPEVHVRLSTEDTDKDNLMVTAVLMDEMADGSAFEAYMINTNNGYRIPVKTTDTYEYGEGHDPGKIKEYVRSYTFCKAFAFGWVDLLDPEADEKNPVLDTKWHTAEKGKYSDYKIILTPSEYKLEKGHVLKLYLFAQDPPRSRKDDANMGVSLNKKDEVYSFKIDNASVEVLLPIR